MKKGKAKRALAFFSVLTMITGLISSVPMGAFAKEVVTEAATVAEEAVTAEVANEGKPTVWFVGDSTVCDYIKEDGTHTDAALYYPRYGYGTQFHNYLDGTFDVKNVALSGRSSLSFLSEDNYKTLKSGIKAGDFLIIGFGHNDEKFEAARYANPTTDVDTDGSFQKIIYDNYVKLAENAGAKAIVCTPMVRYDGTNAYTGDKIHDTSGKSGTINGVTVPGGDYVAAIKELGTAKSVPVVDICGLTKAKWMALGADEAANLHSWSGTSASSIDGTHPNIFGGKMIAYLLAKAIKEQNIAGLAEHITNLTEPTKEKDLVPNPIYVKPEYNRPEANAKSEIADYYVAAGEGESAVKFCPTVFGDVGSADAITADNYTLETLSDGNMRIFASGGAIGDMGDGLAMYYYRLPSDAIFTLKAKATVDTLSLLEGQSAFGLMARDDMYIDQYSKVIASDYVVAGTVAKSEEPYGVNCFRRKNGAVEGKADLANTVIQDVTTYEFEITSNSDGYACSINGEETQTGGYDFKLNVVDDQYQYIGMFANAGMDVTFSDIYLKVGEDVLVDQTAGERYAVTATVDDADQGTARAAMATAKAGTIVTLKATPKTGYRFKEWQSEDVTVSGNKLVMPAKAVTVKALFEESTSVPADVWDFSGYTTDALTSDGNRYTHHITAGAITALGHLTNKMTSGAGTAVYGDLTEAYEPKARFYTIVQGLTGISYDTTGKFTTAYADGFEPKGGMYENGTRSETKGYLLIDNCKVGDVLVMYMGSNSSEAIAYNIKGIEGDAEGEVAELGLANTFAKFTYVVPKAGKYKIYQSSTTGKPLYQRIIRYPAAKVSGTIDMAESGITDGFTVKLVNVTTNAEYPCELSAVEDGKCTFKAEVPAGYKYSAVLSGKQGWGLDPETKVFDVTFVDSAEGKTNVALNVIEKSLYKYNGSIEGYTEDDNNKLENFKIKFTPAPSSGLDTVTVVPVKGADGKITFNTQLETDAEFEVVIVGANDYEVASEKIVNNKADKTENIVLAKKPQYKASGAFTGIEDTDAIEAIVLKNVEDGYTYSAKVNVGEYECMLRDAKYEVVATVKDNKYTTTGHVIVDGADVTKNIFFVDPMAAVEAAGTKDIYVGYKRSGSYATVSEAVKAAAAANPQSEADRITIHIAPGTYREQIMITSPYITLKNDEYAKGSEVLLTWYYGIDYLYYSVGNKGFYDVERAVDKYEKAIPAKWGTCVYVQKTANDFKAEGITFENSFNRYLTEEEMEDGVKLAGKEGNAKVERNYGTDVKAKKATERATAICVEGANSEFNNCSFLSSQDTLYVAANAYFNSCFIEGQTDYIFGSANVVFDACNLSFKGYSSESKAGYITAVKPATDTEKGYLFRNCIITKSADPDVTVTPGYLGRPWGANAKVTFVNTKVADKGILSSETWADWGTGGPFAASANYYEKDTSYVDGTAIANGKASKEVTDASQLDPKTYFGDWTPAFYTEENDTVAIEGNIVVSDNGDINLLKGGHTLTVKYSLGANNGSDASIIKWYTVDGDQETLVKISTAAADKTYKVTEADAGKKIKVEVTPVTVSGKTGEPKSYTVSTKVKTGYEDPSKAGAAELGSGVNVYLCGDSTVKDYSAKGMYNSGTARSEGSWGEFLQTFFDKDVINIVNYANGGRSSRTLINDGVLDDISATIKKGDYIFIQFGHNDCYDPDPSKYAPVGTPDAKGIYPTTPGEMDMDGYYQADCGGTYKWYLKQYIDVAKKVGATPILVTPVSRMYYTADGKIKPHHMATGEAPDSYVEAVKQLASEEKVKLIDGYKLTADLFVQAYADCGSDENAKQIMNTGEKTHNNKVGGMIEALIMAYQIKDMGLSISKYVSVPSKTAGVDGTGNLHFAIDGNGKFTAYNILDGYKTVSEYWTNYGQKMINGLKVKGLSVELDAKNYEYTTGAIIPQVKVTCDGVELAEGVDYKVAYKNNKNVYTVASTDKSFDPKKAPQVIVTGKGNYADVVTVYFTISAPEVLASAENVKGYKLEVPAAYKKGIPYTGKEIDPFKYGYKIKKADGTIVSANTVNCTVTTSNNVKAGTATVLLTGKDNSQAKLSFKIAKADIAQASKIKVDSEAAFEVAGAKPVVSITNNGITLKEGTDYKLSYKNNKVIDPNKKAVVSIKGMGNFAGSKDVVFTVKELNASDLTIIAPSVAAGTKAEKAAVLVFDKSGNLLKNNKDYVMTVSGNTVAGSELTYTLGEGAKAKAKTIKGSTTGTIKVGAAGSFKAAVDKAAVVSYTGEELNVDKYIKAEFKNKADGKTITPGVGCYYVSNVKAGKATVYVYANGTDANGYKKLTFKVNPMKTK